MTADSYPREADRTADGQAAAVEPLDITRAEGEWVSATRLPHGLSRVRVRRVGAALVVNVRGAGEPRPGDWGEVETDSVYVPRHRGGINLTARFDSAAMSSTLHTNQADGLMAVHGFHRFTDGSGRRDYFTREFFVETTGRQSDQEPSASSGGGFPPALLTGEHDPSWLLGSWNALNSPPARFSALHCAQVGGEFTVRAHGAGPDGPIDWGTTVAQLYADGTHPDSPPAFLATFDRDDVRVHLQARDYLGVLVVAEYTQYIDGSGRPGYYFRETFHS